MSEVSYVLSTTPSDPLQYTQANKPQCLRSFPMVPPSLLVLSSLTARFVRVFRSLHPIRCIRSLSSSVLRPTVQAKTTMSDNPWAVHLKALSDLRVAIVHTSTKRTKCKPRSSKHLRPTTDGTPMRPGTSPSGSVTMR